MKIKCHGQLHGIQCSERIVHRVSSNERFTSLKVTVRQQNDFEAPLGKIGKKEAAQLIECCRSPPS